MACDFALEELYQQKWKNSLLLISEVEEYQMFEVDNYNNFPSYSFTS